MCVSKFAMQDASGSIAVAMELYRLLSDDVKKILRLIVQVPELLKLETLKTLLNLQMTTLLTSTL